MVDRFFDQLAEARQQAVERAEVRSAFDVLYNDASGFLRTEQPHIPINPDFPSGWMRLGYNGQIASDKSGGDESDKIPFNIYVGGSYSVIENDERFLRLGIGDIVFEVPKLGQRLVLKKDGSNSILRFEIYQGSERAPVTQRADAAAYLGGFGQLKVQHATEKAERADFAMRAAYNREMGT